MIGKRDIVVTIVYTSDYTNGTGKINELTVRTSADTEIVEYPTLLGILEMAKEKFIRMGDRK